MIAVDLALWVVQASEKRVDFEQTRDARCVQVAFERVRRPRLCSQLSSCSSLRSMGLGRLSTSTRVVVLA